MGSTSTSSTQGTGIINGNSIVNNVTGRYTNILNFNPTSNHVVNAPVPEILVRLTPAIRSRYWLTSVFAGSHFLTDLSG